MDFLSTYATFQGWLISDNITIAESLWEGMNLGREPIVSA